MLDKANVDLSRLRPGIMGQLLYYLLPFRRRIIRRNIRHVFGDTHSKADQKRLAQAYYNHLYWTIYENSRLIGMSQGRIREIVRVEGREHLEAAKEGGKGALILSGHFGNWEFSPLGAMAHYPEYKGRFWFIRTALIAEWIENYLFKKYVNFGLRVIRKKNAMDHVMNVLDQNDAVIFVLDQWASRRRAKGVDVEFFGEKCSTYPSLAILAGLTGSPVIPATAWRDQKGHHVLRFDPPLRHIECADADEEIYKNTKMYNEILEQLVLQRPEQWFWLHRRWKFKEK